MNPNEAPAMVPCIFALRGESVMLDSDLATRYGVETKVLNQDAGAKELSPQAGGR